MSEGVNPNVPVQGEGTVQSRANSAVSFADIEEIDDGPAKAKPESKGKPTGGAKKAANAKVSPADVDGDDSDDPASDEGDEAKDETGKSAAKPEAKAKQDNVSDKPEAADKKPADDASAGKPRNVKFRVGDQDVSVSSNAEFKVRVNGKDEVVTLSDVINEYSGKTNWTRENQKLHHSKREFEQERSGLNERIETLLKKSQENPDTAWDYLCELSGKDPVEVKEGMFRQMIKEVLPLARLDENELEHYIKDRVRDWRDAKHAGREQAAKQDQERQAAAKARTELLSQYNIGDEEYEQAEAQANRWLRDNGHDRKATAQDVVYTTRAMMATEVVNQVCPHLAQNQNFHKIMDDVIGDLLKNPGITKEQLGSMLGKVFGGDQDEGAKRLARKVQKTADLEGDRSLTASRTSKQKTDATFFSDI